MSPSGKRPWRSALALLLVLFVFSVGYVYWRTARAVEEATSQVAGERFLRFTVERIEPPPNPGFEWIGTPAVFVGAERFQDKLYLSGPAGLFEYDGRGALLKQYLVGRELPPSPLGPIARGVIAGSAEPELIIATASEGLLAFNGRGFRQLRPADPRARSVTSVLPLSSGRLLIGTQKKGVLVFDGHSLTPLHSTLADVPVTALAGDEAELWVGTQDRGVLRFHAGQADVFGEPEGLPDARVHAIATAGDRTYVGTTAGVAEFRAGKLERVIAKGTFARALLARDKDLLVGTMDEGVSQVPLEHVRAGAPRARTFEGLGQIQQLFQSEGAAYALAADGLYQLVQGSGWRRVLSREGTLLADRNISALSLDPSGRLWVGYFDRGMDIVAADGRHAQHVEDERVFCVNRILSRPTQDSTYVATANGLVVFDVGGNEQQVLKRSDGLIADHVTDLVPYRGGMAVATPAGLTFLDSSGARSLYAFHGLVNNHVYALAAFGDRLIAGTLGGLSVLDDEKIVGSYTTATSGLKHNWITAVAPLDGEWVVGTYGAGIVRLDSSGRFQPFEVATDRFEVNPNALLVTPTHVFAGSLGRGLYVYDRAAQRWSVVRDGLPSENVTALAAGAGYLYVGTENGLVRIAEQNFR